MVHLLRNVLNFLRVAGIPVEQFESRLKMESGTMKRFLEEKKELTPETMAKVQECYHNELSKQGYYSIDLSPFGGKGLGVIYGMHDEDNPFVENTDEYT